MDTGDALIGGGILGDQTKGEAVLAGMDLMGYDAMALGPNELALGPDLLGQRLAESELAMLSANVFTTESEELFAEPYTIVRSGDQRVGILGLTRVPRQTPAGFQVLDPGETLARYVPEVTQSADVVIVLTNLALRRALTLAGDIEGIDLVVAALPRQLPDGVRLAPATGAMVVTAEQALPRHAGRRVGKLQTTVASDGTLTDASWQSLAMSREIPDDAEMAALLDSFR